MGQTVAAPNWEFDENPPNFVGSLEQAREFLVELADRQPGESVKTAVGNAAKAAGFDYWRTSDLWYRKARRIEEFEREALLAAITKKRRLDARREFIEIQNKLARLAAMLAQTDPEFHQYTLDHLRSRGIAAK